MLLNILYHIVQMMNGLRRNHDAIKNKCRYLNLKTLTQTFPQIYFISYHYQQINFDRLQKQIYH